MTADGLAKGMKPIVVGVDGSPNSLRAVDWAVWEARLAGAPLEVVHVDIVDERALEILEYTAEVEREALALGLERAQVLGPELAITGKVLGPPTVDALLAESQDALMLVLGSRGLGSLRGMLLGSVSQACASEAACPVVIVGDQEASSAGP
jgi:nucleotide-binding universal stress UspA family protein